MSRPDPYLLNILIRELVVSGPGSAVRQVVDSLWPLLRFWGGEHLVSIEPSGSFAKGTCNRSGTDIDLFLSMSSNTPGTLAGIYFHLEGFLVARGYAVKRQGVSLGVVVGGVKVDVVPGRRQSPHGNDHSLYKHSTHSWTKTNIRRHISLVTHSSRQLEIRLLKLWRDQKGLEFPSILLELTVIRALHGRKYDEVARNTVAVLRFLHENIMSLHVVDPSNTANVLSSDLSLFERARIMVEAGVALQGTWREFVR